MDKLVSPAALETLEALARLGHGSTYVVERLHSTNLRRSASRALTHRAAGHHLALHHAAHGSRAVSSMFAPPTTTPSAPKPKEQDVSSEVLDEEAENRSDTGKMSGGGGAWRAFCHLHLSGRKLTSAIATELSMMKWGRASACLLQSSNNTPT